MKELFLAISSSFSRFTSAIAWLSLMLDKGKDLSVWRNSLINPSPSCSKHMQQTRFIKKPLTELRGHTQTHRQTDRQTHARTHTHTFRTHFNFNSFLLWWRFIHGVSSIWNMIMLIVNDGCHGSTESPDKPCETSSSAALRRAKSTTLDGKWAISATCIPKLRSHTPTVQQPSVYSDHTNVSRSSYPDSRPLVICMEICTAESSVFILG